MRTEHELIKCAQAGEIRAFEQLVELNSDKLFGVAYRIVQEQQAAEDCVQEAFLKAYLKLETFKLESKFSTWLYTITSNVALDMLRKRAKHPHTIELNPELQGSLSAHQFEFDNTPETHAVNKNLAGLTHAALSHLSADVRAAFTLRHYEECTIEEITQILGISKSTAKSRIFRGVDRLRQLLQPKIST
ncbi:RNA polymerase sigma-H factor [Arenicella chitinivorans]|uniref:RNA polymerase sigma-H factor n=1 Tax=Arenicella chitinivorans TaxID=1329800 RepID=A0A918VKJ9_9GAMM|nr:sigma-70 family RNA polymerase sigma factor [Arenicella chitinivorans]GHA03905.1 RNA polymerase sigma-H factor [Arenicella chitinivorans]